MIIDDEISREEGDATAEEYPSYVPCEHRISFVMLLSLWLSVLNTPPLTLTLTLTLNPNSNPNPNPNPNPR